MHPASNAPELLHELQHVGEGPGSLKALGLWEHQEVAMLAHPLLAELLALPAVEP